MQNAMVLWGGVLAIGCLMGREFEVEGVGGKMETKQRKKVENKISSKPP